MPSPTPSPREEMKIRRIALWCSGALFAISLFCPAFKLEEGHSSFLLGFVCLLFGFGHLPWYANFFYLASIVALILRRSLLAAILAASAAAIALTTLGIKEMPRNEAGDRTAVVGYGPAFYLWLSSMLVIVIAVVLGSLRRQPPVQMPA